VQYGVYATYARRLEAIAELGRVEGLDVGGVSSLESLESFIVDRKPARRAL
jgi:hypothetical protein